MARGIVRIDRGIDEHDGYRGDSIWIMPEYSTYVSEKTDSQCILPMAGYDEIMARSDMGRDSVVI